MLPLKGSLVKVDVTVKVVVPTREVSEVLMVTVRLLSEIAAWLGLIAMVSE